MFVHPDTIHVLLCGDEQTRARVTAILSVESETQESPGLIRVPAVACLCGRVVA